MSAASTTPALRIAALAHRTRTNSRARSEIVDLEEHHHLGRVVRVAEHLAAGGPVLLAERGVIVEDRPPFRVVIDAVADEKVGHAHSFLAALDELPPRAPLGEPLDRASTRQRAAPVLSETPVPRSPGTTSGTTNRTATNDGATASGSGESHRSVVVRVVSGHARHTRTTAQSEETAAAPREHARPDKLQAEDLLRLGEQGLVPIPVHVGEWRAGVLANTAEFISRLYGLQAAAGERWALVVACGWAAPHIGAHKTRVAWALREMRRAGYLTQLDPAPGYQGRAWRYVLGPRAGLLHGAPGAAVEPVAVAVRSSPDSAVLVGRHTLRTMPAYGDAEHEVAARIPSRDEARSGPLRGRSPPRPGRFVARGVRRRQAAEPRCRGDGGHAHRSFAEVRNDETRLSAARIAEYIEARKLREAAADLRMVAVERRVALGRAGFGKPLTGARHPIQRVNPRAWAPVARSFASSTARTHRTGPPKRTVGVSYAPQADGDHSRELLRALDGHRLRRSGLRAGNSSKGPNDGGARCHPPGQTVNEPGCK